MNRLDELDIPTGAMIHINERKVCICVMNCFEEYNELMSSLYPLISEEGYKLHYESYKKNGKDKICVFYEIYDTTPTMVNKVKKTFRKTYTQIRDVKNG